MTHYPAWIALVVFSAAFAAVNVIGEIEGDDWGQWYHGWPRTWGSHDVLVNMPSDMILVSRLHWVHHTTIVDRRVLIADLLIALLATAGATFQVSKIKAKLSLQAVFAMTAVVGAGCLTLRYDSLDEFLRDARTAALFMIPVAIGLACLSGLNLVGWMYGKCKSR